VERHDRTAVVIINRPELRNALDAATIALLRDRLRELENDADARVVILTGQGDKAFIAGADIGELATRTMHTELGERSRLMRDACTLLETMGKPTIAAINGVAAGGGCELALACDMRVMANSARIGLPEINLGIFPGGGGTQRLLRLCGRGVAAELIMTGRLIGGDDALRLGLVNRVVDGAALMPTVLELAGQIATKSPFALAMVKDALRAAANMSQADGILYENKLFALCMETGDKREGVDAFLAKRPPLFKGA
jgi:enoyl-CoA hydratase